MCFVKIIIFFYTSSHTPTKNLPPPNDENQHTAHNHPPNQIPGISRAAVRHSYDSIIYPWNSTRLLPQVVPQIEDIGTDASADDKATVQQLCSGSYRLARCPKIDDDWKQQQQLEDKTTVEKVSDKNRC